MKKSLKKLLKNQIDLLLLKHWQFLPLELFYRLAAIFQQISLYLWQNKILRKVRFNNIVQPCNYISLTAAASQQQNRDCSPCGKSQSCIQCQKNGMDHTQKVNLPMIHGVQILSISALKVHPCRQRFLRTCPLYLCHMEQIKHREVKERKVIYAHGNKVGIFILAGICFVSLFFLSFKIYEKKTELRLNTKRWEFIQGNLEKSNNKVVNGRNE